MLGSLTSFAQAESASDSFEALLKTLGVTLANGGELERLHLVLKELSDCHKGTSSPPARVDLRKRFRELSNRLQDGNQTRGLDGSGLFTDRGGDGPLHTGVWLEHAPSVYTCTGQPMAGFARARSWGAAQIFALR